MSRLEINKLMFLVFILLTLVGQFSWASEVTRYCTPHPMEDTSVSGRASKISFPDGRFIIVVGHVHGSRQIYDVADKIDSGELAKMSNKAFDDYFHKILRENDEVIEGLFTKKQRESAVKALKEKLQIDISEFLNPNLGYDIDSPTVLNHAKQDYEFLKRLLSGVRWQDKIEFVGYEGSDSAWRDSFPEYLRVQNVILREYYIRKKRGDITLTQDQMMDIILSSSNGNVYAYMQRPRLDTVVPMIGTEDSGAGQEHSMARPIQALNVAANDFSLAMKRHWSQRPGQEKKAFDSDTKNVIYLAKLQMLMEEVVNMNTTSSVELEKRIEELNTGSYPWVTSELSNIFSALRTRVRLNTTRDYYSAKNLVEMYKSGVHFVGINHLRDTLKILSQFCMQEYQNWNSYYSPAQQENSGHQ